MKPLTKEQIEENLRKWFKEKWVRFGPDGKIRGPCARGDESEGKPKCLPQAKAHALGKKGRSKAASRKRRQDPNPERKGQAINVKTKESTEQSNQEDYKLKNVLIKKVAKKLNLGSAELNLLSISELQNLLKHGSEKGLTDLTEFAPDGNDQDGRWYTDDEIVNRVGDDWVSYEDTHLNASELIDDAQAWLDDNGYSVEVKDVKRTDQGYEWYIVGFWFNPRFAKKGVAEDNNLNLIEENNQTCPECGGPSYSNSILAEKQDACYHKVRSRYKVWPSAYASGALVQCRKKGAKNWGNKSESVEQKVNEVAVSKQQQKFFGMVHALQKGEKVPGASKELKSVAKGISKKAAKDFAGTKHKGLPEKVKNNKTTENQNVNEVLGLLGQAATRMAPAIGRGLAVGGGVAAAAGSNSDSSSLQYCVVKIGEQQGSCFNTRQEAQSYLNGLQDKQNYAIKSSMGESKLYYTTASTSEKILKESFNMFKDSNGWYLKETSTNKEKLDALRAFGSPTIVTEGYDPTASNATAATLGPDNIVSPVGSVPKTQRINSKKQGKKNG